MKRSPLPKRSKPLPRSTKPLKRSWLKRGPSKRKRTRPQGGDFIDKRSHITRDGRTVLYGKDMEYLRGQVFGRSQGFCQAEKHVRDCPIRIGWYGGEMDHIIARGMGSGFRDDTLENCRWLSRPCHRKRHS